MNQKQTNLLQQHNSIKDILVFSNQWFKFKSHNYQKRFLTSCINKKRIVGIWCRQSGKSTTVSIYSLYKALTSPNITIIMVAPNQRQSKELYSKVRNIALGNELISSSIIKSTETELTLDNGSRIISLPCGPDGSGIKGFTADIVIIEEAGKFKDNIVNAVVTPMLASKKGEGQLIKIGTPLTRNHFYDSCFKDKSYDVIKIDWRVCVEAGQYSQDFVDEQKEKLTDIEFSTEYEANFIEEGNMFFPIKLLENSMEDYELIEVL